jgi:hypothetical protein
MNEMARWNSNDTAGVTGKYHIFLAYPDPTWLGPGGQPEFPCRQLLLARNLAHRPYHGSHATGYACNTWLPLPIVPGPPLPCPIETLGGRGADWSPRADLLTEGAVAGISVGCKDEAAAHRVNTVAAATGLMRSGAWQSRGLHQQQGLRDQPACSGARAGWAGSREP